MATAVVDQWEVVRRLDKDLRSASRLMGQREARYFVDFYYQLQHFRIAGASQVRASGEQGEPNRVLEWVQDSMRRLEGDVQKALGEFADSYTVGLWMQSIVGIGPVISAGFLSHLSVHPWKCVVAKKPGEACTEAEPHGPGCHRVKIVTAGHFWRFAGLDPTVTWEKKTKRPWNAKLKTLCWKLGQSFMKNQSRDEDYYGKLYKERKERELAMNAEGRYEASARGVLEAKRIGKSTEAYKHYSDGRLPPAHIDARARRWVVKLFLSHLHHVMYTDYFGTEPPVPYAFDKCPGDHRHFIPIPNWPYGEQGKSLREMLDQPSISRETEAESETIEDE